MSVFVFDFLSDGGYRNWHDTKQFATGVIVFTSASELDFTCFWAETDLKIRQSN
jgi:hypothetical protein